MAQQINLLTPILLKPRRHFTAVSMLQALGLILIGSLALAAWIGSRADQRRAEFINRTAALKSQQDALTRTLATLPGADAGALQSLVGVNSVERRGDRVLVQCSDSDVVARYLLTQTAARDVEISSKNLEEAFVALTADDRDATTGGKR